jgi:hypothetical protein
VGTRKNKENPMCNLELCYNNTNNETGGYNMTIAMNNTNDYVKFFDIAVEAYHNKRTDIYRQLMTTLISSYNKLLYDIELTNADLEKEENLSINERELDNFYDAMYAMTDMIKLLKNHLLPLKDKEGLFSDLYSIVDKIHYGIIHHIDIVSTQEVIEIQNRYAQAS